MKKQIAIIGLGKMGGNLARNLLDQSWEVIGYNRSPQPTQELENAGGKGAYSYEELIKQLTAPRLVWVMVPHQAVDLVLGGLAPLLNEGDVVIEGGNSFYEDSMRRAKELSRQGIWMLDCGVSGGPSGARNGACCMIGGKEEVFRQYEELFADISVKGGYGYFGRSGAGHFVKMVHNGIEYGMMQAVAEGFNVMKKSKFNLDLKKVASVYNHGSVIESRLIGWLREAYQEFGEDLSRISGEVAHSGEGQWTVETAEKMGLEVKNIAQALKFRQDSQGNPSYTGRVVSALRGQFGGHPVER